MRTHHAPLFAVAVLLPGAEADADYAPKVAVVACEDAAIADWTSSQASSHGLVGLAGLVGVPYQTLMVEDLVAARHDAFTSVWFSACRFLSAERHAALTGWLESYMEAGGTVFLDGPLGTFDFDPIDGSDDFRGMDALSGALGVRDLGWVPVEGERVFTAAGDTLIAPRLGLAAGTPLTQGVSQGSYVMDVDPAAAAGARVLLEIGRPGATYPFLIATAPPDGGRCLAIGSYGDFVGAATPFRNDGPDAFHDNRLVPFLIESLLWLLDGGAGPLPAIQLSNAPMTVVARLDGDWSHRPEATVETLRYLVDVADRTGVASVYGVVSSFADAGGWDAFVAGGRELEARGGAIGSHSRLHVDDMSGELDDQGWADEVAGSLAHIRTHLAADGFTPAVTAFINPGGPIQQKDYEEFFADVSLFMTHGFETAVPYGSGVMGFGLPPEIEPVAVVNDVPVPDFNWLYSDRWDYTVAEAAAVQRAILDHYQHTIGRGVLYDQMWHDYAIGGELAPVHDPSARARALHDAGVDHFAASRIYAPSIEELTGKLQVAARVALSSAASAERVTVELDFAGVPERYRRHAAGMGLRIERAAAPIASVTRDGFAHAAFADRVVILQAPVGETQTYVIDLAPDVAATPRLTYVSKQPASVASAQDGLAVVLSAPGLATRFCVAGPDDLVLLHADRQAREDGDELCGSLRAAAPFEGFATARLGGGLRLLEATRSIVSLARVEAGVEIALAPGPRGSLTFAAGAPIAAELDGAPVPRTGGAAFVVPVDALGPATLVLRSSACDGPGCSDASLTGGGVGCRAADGGAGAVAALLVGLAALAGRRSSSRSG